jgi:hypothetical protein
MEGMAFLKQKRSFCIDPKKEDFISYGKAKFSYDLARLKIKKFGEKELRLVVASTTRLMDMGYEDLSIRTSCKAGVFVLWTLPRGPSRFKKFCYRTRKT